LCYEVGDAKIIDEAYRTDGASSPSLCSDALSGHPASGASQLFLSDSILYQGSQTVRIPSTIVKQVLGADDTSNAVPEGTTWEELISPSPASPTPLFACLAGVQHDVPGFAIGAQQIANDIIQYCK